MRMLAIGLHAPQPACKALARLTKDPHTSPGCKLHHPIERHRAPFVQFASFNIQKLYAPTPPFAMFALHDHLSSTFAYPPSNFSAELTPDVPMCLAANKHPAASLTITATFLHIITPKATLQLAKPQCVSHKMPARTLLHGGATTITALTHLFAQCCQPHGTTMHPWSRHYSAVCAY